RRIDGLRAHRPLRRTGGAGRRIHFAAGVDQRRVGATRALVRFPTAPSRDQEFDIAFCASDRALNHAQDTPAGPALQPFRHSATSVLAQGGVAYDPALADARVADLELRLDEGD